MFIVTMKNGARNPALATFFAVLFVAVFVARPARLWADVPHGVFSLSISDRAANQPVLDNPDVDGISIRAGWAGLEPAEGVFDWTFVDSEVARAAAAGKKVLLRIGTQAGKPDWVTQAVTNAGGVFFTFDDNGVTTSIPVFWDPTYLAKKKAMIAALGVHFANNPTVKIVTASFANATSEDWNVPHTPDLVARWLSLGYTSEKMLDAGKQIIDATMVAFPNQFVAMAIGGNGYGPAIWTLTPRTSRAMPSSPRALHGLDGFWSKSTVSPLLIRRLRVLRIQFGICCGIASPMSEDRWSTGASMIPPIA